MPNDRTILISGVTGNQGGAVAHALQAAGFHLRGLTRNPDGERAAALARQGVEVVKAQATRQDRASCGLEIACTRFVCSPGRN